MNGHIDNIGLSLLQCASDAMVKDVLRWRSAVVYVAAPYTIGDPVTNTAIAIDVGNILWTKGLVPFVPHSHSFSWHLKHPLPYEEWMALDLAILARCHGLIRVPGVSEGADREVTKAELLGIPVLDMGLFSVFEEREFQDRFDRWIRFIAWPCRRADARISRC